MMNMAADPQTRPNDPGCESACRLPEATHCHGITQLKSWYSFYHPTEGRRLSRPMHCRKGVQPVPKAVYRSGFYEKHATAHGGIWTLVSHTAVGHVTARLRSAATDMPPKKSDNLTTFTQTTMTWKIHILHARNHQLLGMRLLFNLLNQ